MSDKVLRIYTAEYGETTIYLGLAQKALIKRFGSMPAFAAQVAERHGVDLVADDARDRLATILSDNSTPLVEGHPYVVVRQGSTVADSRVSQSAFRALAGQREEQAAEASAEKAEQAADEGIDILTPVLVSSIQRAGGDFGLCKKRLDFAHRWPTWKTQSTPSRSAMIAELPVDDAREMWDASLAGGQMDEDDLGKWLSQLRSSQSETTDTTAPPAPSRPSSPDSAPRDSREMSEPSTERRSAPGRRQRRRRTERRSAPS